jgi:hypothetical protein
VLEDTEISLQQLKMKKRKQKANISNMEEWLSLLKEAKIVKGSKKGKAIPVRGRGGL